MKYDSKWITWAPLLVQQKPIHNSWNHGQKFLSICLGLAHGVSLTHARKSFYVSLIKNTACNKFWFYPDYTQVFLIFRPKTGILGSHVYLPTLPMIAEIKLKCLLMPYWIHTWCSAIFTQLKKPFVEPCTAHARMNNTMFCNKCYSQWSLSEYFLMAATPGRGRSTS